ncbi:WD40-repeat-containing domain protein [Dipodascopsis uninucleata]
MISGGSDTRICIWDLYSREGGRHRYEMVGGIPARKGHQYGLTGTSWWPFDDGLFITSSFDETVKIWDTQTLEEVYKFGLGARVNSHDISKIAEHCLVACAADMTPIRLLDLRSSSSAQMLHSHQGTTVNAVRWSPTNPYMLASGGSDGTVRLWDIRRSNACLTVLNMENVNSSRIGRSSRGLPQDSGISNAFSSPASLVLNDVKSHRGVVNGLLWFEDGRKLISTGTDETIRVWDLTVPFHSDTNTLVNFGPFARNRYQQFVNMVLSPVRDCAPQLLFYPSDDGSIRVFQVNNGRLIRNLETSITTRQKRACGLVCRGSEFVEIFSGISDGEIVLIKKYNTIF